MGTSRLASAGWSEIPPSAWRYLWPAPLHEGIVKGRGDIGTQLFDVRAKAVLPLRLPDRHKGGRPKKIDRIMPLFELRKRRGLTEASKAREAKVLATSDEANHTHDPISPRSIQNWLGTEEGNEAWQAATKSRRKP